ncbi:urease accessory protein UreF [Microbaculum marinum]|uniref:Urease accessory protein UreF n=1 Tax=Microbaculum marinum TaxID=1764581 RepID=A0AAW9RYF6_9HYPH
MRPRTATNMPITTTAMAIIIMADITTGTEMADAGSDQGVLYRLLAWLSPSYPVGAYSHSHGLEWAVEAGEVREAAGLGDWVAQIVRYGSGRQDAILLAETWRAAVAGDDGRLAAVAELAAALAPSRERQVETVAQGRAFVLATDAAWPTGKDGFPEVAEMTYPVAVALAAARHDVPLGPVLTGYLHAFAANLVSAGVRLIPLGQTDGQRVIARLEADVADVAREALVAGPDDLGGCVLLADIASMRHETQYTRLFRT